MGRSKFPKTVWNDWAHEDMINPDWVFDPARRPPGFQKQSGTSSYYFNTEALFLEQIYLLTRLSMRDVNRNAHFPKK